MIATIEFSPDQEIAVAAIEQWRDSGHKPYLTLGGYAGSGKSVIVAHLESYWGSTAVVAMCGKAANVLRQKGVADAKTIHSLIYVPFENDQGKVCFRKRDQLDGIRFIIVDEASMVDHLLMHDLLSFGIPALFVGDHGQLEPIGSNPGLMKNPEIRLENIHRQARGNPILRLATAFREGRDVPRNWSDHNGRLQIVHRSQFDRLVQPEGPQVICGFNKTRHAVNARVREMAGIESPLPTPGEKLICLRNNKEFGIFNGQLFRCLEVSKPKRSYVDLLLESEDGGATTIPCLRQQFGVNVLADFKRKDVALFDFGYALTCHKAQGSEWADVLILEEIAGIWNPCRWRYTATTRAAETLTYCA